MAPLTEVDVLLAKRVRAAIAYSGLRAEDIVEKLGGDLGLATLRRIMSETHPRSASLDEQWRIADICGVPRSWLEGGWEEPVEQPVTRPTVFGRGDPLQRLELVERYMEAIVSQTGVTAGAPVGKAPRSSRKPRRARP